MIGFFFWIRFFVFARGEDSDSSDEEGAVAAEENWLDDADADADTDAGRGGTRSPCTCLPHPRGWLMAPC